jgi:hypothetical protein
MSLQQKQMVENKGMKNDDDNNLEIKYRDDNNGNHCNTLDIDKISSRLYCRGRLL